MESAGSFLSSTSCAMSFSNSATAALYSSAGGTEGCAKTGEARSARATREYVWRMGAFFLPSPLAGEGGSRSEPGEGLLCGGSDVTPHPRHFVPLPSPARGEGEDEAVSLVDQQHIRHVQRHLDHEIALRERVLQF